MKKIFLFITIAAAVIVIGCRTTKVSEERDYAYEHYCDSIWDADPDYYMDVLEETDKYSEYIEIHGEWWAE